MTVISDEPPEVGRDRWDRPLVIPLGGGKLQPYTRCTTFVGAVEDQTLLGRWKQRMVALGLADRPDLLLAVAAHREDKTHLNRLCEDALEAAKANAGATTGTALHRLTQLKDLGRDIGVVPLAYVPDLAAYDEATRDLTAVHIEQFCVHDPYKIGGTPDRIVTYQGRRYIADLKTGSIDYGYLKIAAQLAVYARSHMYDVTTGTRTPHNAELDRGIIVHMPAGSGTCTLYWVDLLEGWNAVIVSRQVREKRALKLEDLVSPFTDPPTPISVQPTLEATGAAPTLTDLILGCSTPEQVRDLWRQHTTTWTPALTDVATRHVAALEHPPIQGVTA